MRVLIVEDDKTVSEFLKGFLENAGYEVQIVECLNEALDVVKTRPVPSVVLCDLILPDGDGKKLVKHIADKQLHINTIILSSDGEKLKDTHMFGFPVMEKPINLRKLTYYLSVAR